MNQDEALRLLSPRLYSLLRLMFARFRAWAPKLGFPAQSIGFNSGGSVSDFEDLEEECDSFAVRSIEAGFADLSLAERTLIEQVIGLQPWVWSGRPGVLEGAIKKLEKKLRTDGVI